MTKRGNGFKDITGLEFNGCKVIKYLKTEKKRAIFLCECFCGEMFEGNGVRIRNGKKKSCGCLRGKVGAERFYKHGKSNTRLHRIWANMKARCSNPNNTAYDRYGGRGIKVFDDWMNSFQKFEEWALANGYADDLSIDRIDNNGNYEPNNCQWSDHYEQGRNKRNNALSFYKGEMRTRIEISEMTGLSYSTIRRREESGISFDKPLRVHKDGKYSYPDEVHP